MAPRKTRASAAAESTATVPEPQQLSSPPQTPAALPKRATRTRKPTSPKSVEVKKEPAKKSPKSLVSPASTRKRARATDEELPELDELPHGLGHVAAPDGSEEPSAAAKKAASPPKKRARRSPKTSQAKEDVSDVVDASPALKTESPPSKKRAGRAKKAPQIKADPEESKDPKPETGDIASPVPSVPAKGAKLKKNKYGFMPGQTPYPDYPHPTPEECYEVDRILSKVHGKVKQPEAIPVPSVTVAGCGEVPSILDALIRTRLSAATTNTNSSRAFQGLVKTFGTIKDGIGKGSVNWNAVRLASQPEVFEAIKAGGLAQVKSKDIKAILEMTYQENQARKDALKSESAADPAGAENEPNETKQSEIEHAESEILSLDHLHVMDTQDAIDHMVTFPGIGAKTAACVALFCMRRSCFAVDTHVFRLCQYLGWVPPVDTVRDGQPKVTRNTAYTHCEARVPDDLKYSLHQLLIKHGKTCPRCRAATSTSSEKWEEGCKIEHLVTRYGAKKGGVALSPAKKRTSAKGASRKKTSDGDSEIEESTPKSLPKRAAAKKGKRIVESEGSEDEPSDFESDVASSDLSDAESGSDFE